MPLLRTDSVQIIEQNPDRLRVLVPPYYSMALLMACIAGLPMVVFAYVARDGAAYPRIILGIVCLLVWALIAFLVSSETSITLSRPEDRLAVERRIFGIQRASRTYPLHEVDAFVLYAATGNSVEAAFKSGEQVSLTKSVTTQAGYGAAIHSMNRFLEAV